jgi:uncharacterized protein (TIGR03792 family)
MGQSIEPSLTQAKRYIEILEFQVAAADRADFVAIDQSIWTPGLARCPAFHSKEIWLDPPRPDLVTVVIQWRDRELWKAIDVQELSDLAAEFDRTFNRPYQLIGEREYFVEDSP